MAAATQLSLQQQVEDAAKIAGLKVTETTSGTDFTGKPTTKFTLANAEGKTETLEFSANFDFGRAEIQEELKTYFAHAAKRLRNPRPDCYVTIHGLPLSFRNFAWPFHTSTSGADTYIVHGEAWLEDGAEAVLHAKISASMTLTFAEIVPAMEQPFAENFIYNAVRKTMDQGQLELVKSGNRQPVPVTTRYYSRWRKSFVFNDTTEQLRLDFIAKKVYWLSGVLGAGQPVWVVDPRDAQYLNTTVEDLKKIANDLASDGVIQLTEGMEYATPTEGLMQHRAEFEKELQDSLNFAKPQFNEDMRAGKANM
ncbi:hypothetical protein [Terriglobus tenax]|uniref:hypothetical protein n=1 Tax=Terriglobus tenax TaxID=1111115 RepID=UPI0021E02108|nr:hypothetical protein [Terriglobus tenax]